MGESHPKLPQPSKMPSCSPPATAIRNWSSESKTGLGTFDAESARHLMDRPVAMKSNLHSVLFETHNDALLGCERLEGRQAGRRAAVPRVQAQ